MRQKDDFIVIPVRRIYLWFLFIGVALLVMNFFPTTWCSTCGTFFDLNEEANIPTWFSSLLLISVSIAALLIHILGCNYGNNTSWHFFWLLFGSVFCFLSLDEVTGLHEMIASRLNIRWIWIYAPAGIICFIIFAYFLEYINKNNDLTNAILGGFTIYVLGALTGEILSSELYLGKAEAALEEGFEMLGAIIVLTGCLKEVNRLLRIICDPRE